MSNLSYLNAVIIYTQCNTIHLTTKLTLIKLVRDAVRMKHAETLMVASEL